MKNVIGLVKRVTGSGAASDNPPDAPTSGDATITDTEAAVDATAGIMTGGTTRAAVAPKETKEEKKERVKPENEELTARIRDILREDPTVLTRWLQGGS